MCLQQRLFASYTICMQYRMIEKCMDRPTRHESMKWCNEKVLLGKLTFWSTVSELRPFEDKGNVWSVPLGMQRSMLCVCIVTAWYAGQLQVICQIHSVFILKVWDSHKTLLYCSQTGLRFIDLLVWHHVSTPSFGSSSGLQDVHTCSSQLLFVVTYI